MHTEDQNQLLPQASEESLEISVSISETLSEDAAFAAPLSPEQVAELNEIETAQTIPMSFSEYTSEQLQAAVEATLFMHHKPVTLAKLRELINPTIGEEEYRTAISNLMALYFEESRGIELVEVAHAYQFRTKQEHKDILRRMFQITPMKLTNAMLEVLAITAYNQPITKDAVEKIRGVDSSHLFRVLMDKKMLRIAGKSDDLGKPMLYATTKEFLELFGLRDLSALPSLREIEDMLPKNEVGSVSEEEVLAKEMEGIVADSKPIDFNDLELAEEGLLDGQEIIEKREENAETKGMEHESVPPQAHSHGSEKIHDGEARDAEAGDSFDLPPEALRHLPLGPEGNA